MATEQVTKKARKPRERKPSAFKPSAKVTISIHSDATTDDTVNTEAGINALASLFSNAGLATRTVHRTRAGAGDDATPSYMVYVAPKGFEFPSATTAKGGVRLDKDVADMLRAIAASMGLDPAKPESIAAVAKALAAKATPAS